MSVEHMYDFELSFDRFLLSTRVTVGVPSCTLRVGLRQAAAHLEGAVDPDGAAALADLLLEIADDQSTSPSPYARHLVQGSVAASDGCSYGLSIEPYFGQYRLHFKANGTTLDSDQVDAQKLRELAAFFTDLGQALGATGSHAPDAENEQPGPGHRSRVSPLGSN